MKKGSRISPQISVVKDSEPIAIDLFTTFADNDNNNTDAELNYSVIENTNPDVVDPAGIDANSGTLNLNVGEVGFTDLTIRAENPQGDTVTDTFRVKVTGEDAYTIAVLPDTQYYPVRPEISEIFSEMTQWLVDNKDNLNIDFAMHVGDIVDLNTAPEWDIADDAMSILDGEIPYSVLPGNHDMGEDGSANVRDTALYNETFSVERFEDTETFGGVYDVEPNSYDNNYHTYTAPDGTDWLVLSLEFGPRDDVLRWANEVLQDHRDHRTILVTHDYMNFDELRHDPLAYITSFETAGYDYGLINDPEGANDGETIWRKLVKEYPNITMVFNGHIFGDGTTQLVSYSDYNTPVYQILNNYQDGVSTEITGNGDPSIGDRGGNGAIRLVTIDPTENQITEETFFVTLDEHIIDFREKPELDRDGLTGSYIEHEIALYY